MISESLTILLTADFYDKYLSRIYAISPPQWTWRRLQFPRKNENISLHDVDILISREDISDADYCSARQLKLFQLVTAGYDHIDVERAKKFGVLLCNNGGANAISVAEHTFMMMLALYRNLLFHHHAVMFGPWINKKYENRELCGKTIGIVGCGRVGFEVAKRSYCFGMNVLYCDPRKRTPEEEQAWNLQQMDYENLLNQSDIVSYHVTLNPTTRHMINDRSIQLMKEGALLLNTSRGGVQDEQALVHGLRSGHLGGVGLDVFSSEPLEEKSPLRSFDNVVFSPHSGPSFETIERVIQNVVKNCLHISRGELPEFCIADV